MDEHIKGLKDDQQEVKDSGHSHHGHRDKGGSWIFGLLLIALGAIFLLNNFTGFELNNWWALFILLPAMGALGNFWRSYRNAGHMNGEAAGSLIGALLMGTVAGMFLFGLNWGVMWPVFIIIIGLGALLSGVFGD